MGPISKVETEDESRASRESRRYHWFFGVVLAAWAIVAVIGVEFGPTPTNWWNGILTLAGGWIVTVGVYRPDRRRAIVAAVLLDVLSLAVPVYASAGLGAAIVFPLLGSLLLVPSYRGRVLALAFVLGWAVSLAGTTIAFLAGPLARLSTLTYPPATIATGALLTALAYVTVWWVASKWQVALDRAVAATDRAEASEATLRGSEARARILIEESGDGILVSDASGRYIEANPALCRMLGYSRDQLLAMGAGDLTAADDALGNAGIEERLAEAKGGSGILVERRYRKADGTSLPVEVRFRVLPDGRQERNVRDISERERAATALRASEARYRALIEQAADGILVLDRDGRVREVNPRVEHVLGLAAREVLGHDVGEFIAPTTLAERSIDLTTLGPGESILSERTITSADGTVSRMELRVSAMSDGRFQVIARDLTERRRAEAERARLAAALEQTVDGVVMVDLQGDVTYANPAFLAAIGLETDAVIGRPAAQVAGELAGPVDLAGLERAALAPTPSLQEVDRTGVDGTIRHLQVSVTPVRDERATVTGFVVVARDVTDLRKAEASVALEAAIRVALAESLETIPQDASLEQAAQAICDHLVKLPFVDLASIDVFLGPADVLIIGHSAPPDFPVKAGDRLPPYRAEIVREQVANGPWAGYPTPDPDQGGWMARGTAAGLKALAFGPIVHGDELVGALVIGTFDQRFARTIVEEMPAIVSFSTASSALLAERMHHMRRQAELRSALETMLADRAFKPVFQPIVDLESGKAVGYEALTRFDSGQRPDLCFADAWSVDLGDDLEFATIEAALTDGRRLPAGHWLDVNVSPRLLADPERLRAALRTAGRPVVLEITEHEVIEDYGAVRDAIRSVGGDVRVAVDDAGAGVANFGHIIELRPDFVKLDISLVRRVNANLGRQALVVAMRHFSRTAGCRLVAEGIETEAEARTLAGFGVEFGQGYLFGRPAPVDVWVAAARAVESTARDAPGKPATG